MRCRGAAWGCWLVVMMRLTDVGGETWSVSFPLELILWCLVAAPAPEAAFVRWQSLCCVRGRVDERRGGSRRVGGWR